MVRRRRPINRGDLPPNLTEVLYEFQRHGNIMRVVAIDPNTGFEVTMIADPRHGEHAIKLLAARKLAYVMQKKAHQAENFKTRKTPFRV